MKNQLQRALKAQIARRRGQNRHLLKAIDEMPVQALQELGWLMRDMEQEIQNEKRTFRPFPGGPKIRL